MTIALTNDYVSRDALYKQYAHRLGVKTYSGYDNEVVWMISAYYTPYPEIGAHLDYDMSAVSRIYGVSVYTARKTLIDYLSRLGLVEMCAAYLRYLHDVYENPLGDNEGVYHL